jgi:hypothetical protein
VSAQADGGSLAARLWAWRWPKVAWAAFAVGNLASSNSRSTNPRSRLTARAWVADDATVLADPDRHHPGVDAGLRRSAARPAKGRDGNRCAGRQCCPVAWLAWSRQLCS